MTSMAPLLHPPTIEAGVRQPGDRHGDRAWHAHWPTAIPCDERDGTYTLTLTMSHRDGAYVMETYFQVPLSNGTLNRRYILNADLTDSDRLLLTYTGSFAAGPGRERFSRKTLDALFSAAIAMLPVHSIIAAKTSEHTAP